jgi:hypothetical protein
LLRSLYTADYIIPEMLYAGRLRTLLHRPGSQPDKPSASIPLPLTLLLALALQTAPLLLLFCVPLLLLRCPAYCSCSAACPLLLLLCPCTTAPVPRAAAAAPPPNMLLLFLFHALAPLLLTLLLLRRLPCRTTLTGTASTRRSAGPWRRSPLASPPATAARVGAPMKTAKEAVPGYDACCKCTIQNVLEVR